MIWTPGLDKCLMDSLTNGCNTTEIARHLTVHGFKVSRCAVIGRKQRLGLCAKGKRRGTRLEPRARPAKPIESKPKPTITLPPVAIAGPFLAIVATLREGPLQLTELKHDSCRFPIGDPKSASFHFCGAEVHANKPYCTEHCSIAYVHISRRGKFRPWTPQMKRDMKRKFLEAAE